MVRERFTVLLISLHGKTESAKDEKEVIYLTGADECIRNDIYGANKIKQRQLYRRAEFEKQAVNK